MKLSLSVRIVESACKTRLHIPFQELVSVAKSSGYDAICMRASAGGVDSPTETLAGLRAIVEDAGLQVSMVTADVNVPLNNDRGPDSLRNIGPSLDVAEALGCDLIRVCLKRHEDIAYARTAADQAAKRGIRLAHQCHTATLFEEVDSILSVLTEINRPNFGLIYEPANLLLCGQSYAADTLTRLRPFLMNVYAQNHRLDQHGPRIADDLLPGRGALSSSRSLGLWWRGLSSGVRWPASNRLRSDTSPFIRLRASPRRQKQFDLPLAVPSSFDRDPA